MGTNRNYWIDIFAGTLSLIVCVIFYICLNKDAGFFLGFGICMIIIGIRGIIRLEALKKDSDKARDYEAKQHEERTVFLATKARALVFVYSIYAEVIIGVILYFIPGARLPGTILCCIPGLQLFAYSIVYNVLNKKY